MSCSHCGSSFFCLRRRARARGARGFFRVQRGWQQTDVATGWVQILRGPRLKAGKWPIAAVRNPRVQPQARPRSGVPRQRGPLPKPVVRVSRLEAARLEGQGRMGGGVRSKSRAAFVEVAVRVRPRSCGTRSATCRRRDPGIEGEVGGSRGGGGARLSQVRVQEKGECSHTWPFRIPQSLGLRTSHGHDASFARFVRRPVEQPQFRSDGGTGVERRPSGGALDSGHC